MNPNTDSTPAAAHCWNLEGSPPARRPAPGQQVPSRAQVIVGPRPPLQPHLRLSVSIGDAASTQVPAAAFDLLRRMPRVDSLRQAASGLGWSYRHAWELIRGAERALGMPLIDTRRGKGTRLTPYGELLASALEEIESKLASELDAATQALSAALALGRPRARGDATAAPDAVRPGQARAPGTA